MKVSLTPIDPALAFPERYAIYKRIRAHTTTQSQERNIPAELLHVNRLAQPISIFSEPIRIKRFAPFTAEPTAQEAGAYMQMATQALVRTQFLCVGYEAIVTPSPDSYEKNAWHVEYNTNIPLDLGELRPFTDVVATAKIFTHERERRRKRTMAITGLTMAVTGRHIDNGNSEFSTYAEVIDDWAWANDVEVGARGAIYFAAHRIASVLQYTDALEFVETHRIKPPPRPI